MATYDRKEDGHDLGFSLMVIGGSCLNLFLRLVDGQNGRRGFVRCCEIYESFLRLGFLFLSVD